MEKITLPNGQVVDFLEDHDMDTMTQEQFDQHRMNFKAQMRKFDLYILNMAKETLEMAENRMKDILRFVRGRIKNKRMMEEDIFYRFYYYARRFNLYESMMLFKDLRRAKKDFYHTKFIIWNCKETIAEIHQAEEEVYGLPSQDHH